jgi:hypothetical protein
LYARGLEKSNFFQGSSALHVGLLRILVRDTLLRHGSPEHHPDYGGSFHPGANLTKSYTCWFTDICNDEYP